MTMQEHIEEAERLARIADVRQNRDPEWAAIKAQLAQVHATLALAMSQAPPMKVEQD
jgi:hypothetical protein